jgi:hypothetical protein
MKRITFAVVLMGAAALLGMTQARAATASDKDVVKLMVVKMMVIAANFRDLSQAVGELHAIRVLCVKQDDETWSRAGYLNQWAATLTPGGVRFLLANWDIGSERGRQAGCGDFPTRQEALLDRVKSTNKVLGTE